MTQYEDLIGCDARTPDAPGPGYIDCDHAILLLINVERTKANIRDENLKLKPLQAHPALLQAAIGHAKDMAAHNKLSHYGSNGSTWADRCKAAGYPGADLTCIGENVAGGQNSPQQAISDWMQSSGHRAAILNPKAQHIGSSAATGTDGWTYWVSDFGWSASDLPPTSPDYLLI